LLILDGRAKYSIFDKNCGESEIITTQPGKHIYLVPASTMLSVHMNKIPISRTE
jgi:hypothetical protein